MKKMYDVSEDVQKFFESMNSEIPDLMGVEQNPRFKEFIKEIRKEQEERTFVEIAKALNEYCSCGGGEVRVCWTADDVREEVAGTFRERRALKELIDMVRGVGCLSYENVKVLLSSYGIRIYDTKWPHLEDDYVTPPSLLEEN